jgi:hypothetical protein
MSDRPKKLVVNCTTKEEQLIDLTDEEIAELEARAEAAATEQAAREAADEAAAEAKASAEAKLTALGLTSDEVAAIIGR